MNSALVSIDSSLENPHLWALSFEYVCCATNSTSQDIQVCCRCEFYIMLLCIILPDLDVLKIALLKIISGVWWCAIALVCFKRQGLTPGGHSTFFSGRGVRPGFPKCGACELTFDSEKGGLVSGKFQNLGACELKISKFGGLWAKIWVKIEAVETKISKFSQKGVLWTDSFAWNGTLASGRRGVKRGSSGPHILIPTF